MTYCPSPSRISNCTTLFPWQPGIFTFSSLKSHIFLEDSRLLLLLLIEAREKAKLPKVLIDFRTIWDALLSSKPPDDGLLD